MSITVGDSTDVSQGHQICHTFCGSMGFNRRKYFSCSSVLTGRYVALKRSGLSVYFSICEVEVYGPKGESKCHHFRSSSVECMIQLLVLEKNDSH